MNSKTIQVNNQKSMDTLLRSFNSRANSQQGKRRTNFIVKKFQYLQAKSYEASRYHSSVEYIESSSSDNDEDFNKSTSIDSTEVGHSLTLQP
jgi:homoaconitase/3-isopropylmalate dehydratase large subunit